MKHNSVQLFFTHQAAFFVFYFVLFIELFPVEQFYFIKLFWRV